jgi:hypothetical protein
MDGINAGRKTIPFARFDKTRTAQGLECLRSYRTEWDENGTGDEGQMLPQWADEQRLRSIVGVATKDHSRRLWRVLDRAMKGHPMHFTVQAARYSSFDPDRWWETRKGVRTEIAESPETLARLCAAPTVILTSSLSCAAPEGSSRFTTPTTHIHAARSRA